MSETRSTRRRGQVLPLVAAAMVGIIGMMALLLDAARGYVDRAELARAVDAAALAAARSYRQGEEVARAQAEAVASANRVARSLGVSLQISFGVNDLGEHTINVSAVRPMDTPLARFIGTDQVAVAASATSAVPPVDLVLVLDQSGSLAAEGAWDDLQDAASEFVSEFDDRLDKLGLVGFQLHASHREMLGAPFKSRIRNTIGTMASAGDTNVGEGLRRALEQLESGEVRERSAKVVVFFTDGRPTALREQIQGRDRGIAVPTTEAGWVRGYFDDMDSLDDDVLHIPDGCRGVRQCYGWDEDRVREGARQAGIDQAEALRAKGIHIYAIALGNPDAGDPLITPDLDYLRILANEAGVVDADQPQGRTYFAPTPADLQAVFDRVSHDLLVRLSQ